MTVETPPSPTKLRQLLDYAPKTGALVWKARPIEMFPSARIGNSWNARWAGKPALATTGSHGYLFGSMLGAKYRAHRVIWAMQTGEWPTEEIDHIDHCTSNNRWQNLRPASHALNGKNYSISKRNKSGVTGVCWNKKLGKWGVRIKTKTSYKHIGLFSCLEAAKAARKAADLEHGYHANHGKGRSIVGICP